MWKHEGDRGFAARVDRLFALAAFAAAELGRRERFELLAPVESLNVCFRYLPANGPRDPAAIDRLNVEARERLRKSGRAMVNYSRLEGRVTMRLVFANPEIGDSDAEGI